MSFFDDIKAFETKALQKASDNTNKVIETLFNKVVDYSPVKPSAMYSQGVLINQWYPAIGDKPSGIVSNSSSSTGAESRSRIKEILSRKPFLGKDSVVTLANNVSYAYRAEKLGWPAGEGDNGWHWSGRVGPYAMVAKAMSNIRGINDN